MVALRLPAPGLSTVTQAQNIGISQSLSLPDRGLWLDSLSVPSSVHLVGYSPQFMEVKLRL
ncbi:hypothetical protein J6590_003465 [Homalodisca vitripennis]|nr:hypothetical protein J6590_003465 [Homalodisca vitripennis]